MTRILNAQLPIICDDETIAAAAEGLYEMGGSKTNSPEALKKQNIKAFYEYWSSSRAPRKMPACAGGGDYKPDEKICAMLEVAAQLDPAADGASGCKTADDLRTGACLILSRELREGRWVQAKRKGQVVILSKSVTPLDNGRSRIAYDQPVNIPPEIHIWMYGLKNRR